MQRELKQIVMIDDDEDDREFFKTAIDCINPQISVVSLFDGVYLTEYMQNNPSQKPDILFLDINMPRKDGFECLQELRAKYDKKELPIVMYSTSESDFDIHNSQKLGANLYLKKPTDFGSLKKALSKVLEIDWSMNGLNESDFFFTE